MVKVRQYNTGENNATEWRVIKDGGSLGDRVDDPSSLGEDTQVYNKYTHKYGGLEGLEGTGTKVRQYNTGEDGASEWRVIKDDGSLGDRVDDWAALGDHVSAYDGERHEYGPAYGSGTELRFTDGDEASLTVDELLDRMPSGIREELDEDLTAILSELRNAPDSETFDTLEEKLQDIVSAATTESNAKARGEYAEIFREYTGQDPTGDPEQDEIIWQAQAEAEWVETLTPELQASYDSGGIAAVNESIGERFFNYTGKEMTGDPVQDDAIWNARTEEIKESNAQAEAEWVETLDPELKASYDSGGIEAVNEAVGERFLEYTGKEMTGDPVQDDAIWIAQERELVEAASSELDWSTGDNIETVAGTLPEHLQGDFRTWATGEVGRIVQERDLLDAASNEIDWSTGDNIETVVGTLPEHLQGDFQAWATGEVGRIVQERELVEAAGSEIDWSTGDNIETVAGTLPEHLQGDFRTWATGEVGRIAQERELVEAAGSEIDWSTGDNIETVAGTLPEHLQGDFQAWATEQLEAVRSAQQLHHGGIDGDMAVAGATVAKEEWDAWLTLQPVAVQELAPKDPLGAVALAEEMGDPSVEFHGDAGMQRAWQEYQAEQQRIVNLEGGQYATGDFWEQLRRGVIASAQEQASLQAGEASIAPDPDELLKQVTLENYERIRPLLPDTLYRLDTGEAVPTDKFLADTVLAHEREYQHDVFIPGQKDAHSFDLQDESRRVGGLHEEGLAAHMGELDFHFGELRRGANKELLTFSYQPQAITLTRPAPVLAHEGDDVFIPGQKDAHSFDLQDESRREEAGWLNELRESKFEGELAAAQAQAQSEGKVVVVKEYDPYGKLRTIGEFLPFVGTGLAGHSFVANRPELGLPSAMDSRRLTMLALSGGSEFLPLPVAPAARLGIRSGKAGLSAILKQPWAETLMSPSPTRFHGAAFVSTKPLQQRMTEVETYWQGVNRQLEVNNPAHWQDVLAATKGKGYSLESMPNLWHALVNENIDVAAMLKARDALVRGVSTGQATTVPTLAPDVMLTATPSAFQSVYAGPRGLFAHGTADVRPFMAGGNIEPIERYIRTQQPGQVGLFGAPDVMVGEVLERPYSKALQKTVGDPSQRQPGYVLFEGGGDVVIPPKLSLQNVGRANEITVRDLENLGPSGPVVQEGVEDAARVLTVRTKRDSVGSLYVLPDDAPDWVSPKRLRATVVASRDDGSILLVKGKRDSMWHLPGGDVKGGESVADAALRELEEETGLAALSAERAFGLDAPNTWHEVSVARVNAGGSIEAQLAEIGDWIWWDGQAAVPMNRSTRTILGRILGGEPPKTGLNTVIPGHETYDWWPGKVSLGEIEATLSVGSWRRPIDPSLTQRIFGAPRTAGRQPALYFEEGATPPSRGQILQANLEQLRRYYLTGKEAGVDYLDPGRQRAATRGGTAGAFDDFEGMDDVAMEGRGLYDDDYRLGAADDVADEGRGQYDPADDPADRGARAVRPGIPPWSGWLRDHRGARTVRRGIPPRSGWLRGHRGARTVRRGIPPWSG